MNKVDILAIGVHPDDIELCAAGTLISHIDQGGSVGIVDLTQGELGTRGTPELRLSEADKAGKIMGVDFRENAGFKDGFFKGDEEEKLEIVKFIRSCQPKILITNAIRDRHPDHGRAAKLVYDAWFLSGLASVKTYVDGELQSRWRPDVIYHFIQDYIIEPDFVVDISDTFERKMEAIKAFKSQFYDPDSKELDSPLTNQDFFAQIEGRARSLGRQIGVEFGEGYTSHRYVGVSSLLDLL